MVEAPCNALKEDNFGRLVHVTCPLEVHGVPPVDFLGVDAPQGTAVLARRAEMLQWREDVDETEERDGDHRKIVKHYSYSKASRQIPARWSTHVVGCRSLSVSAPRPPAISCSSPKMPTPLPCGLCLPPRDHLFPPPCAWPSVCAAGMSRLASLLSCCRFGRKTRSTAPLSATPTSASRVISESLAATPPGRRS